MITTLTINAEDQRKNVKRLNEMKELEKHFEKLHKEGAAHKTKEKIPCGIRVHYSLKHS